MAQKKYPACQAAGGHYHARGQNCASATPFHDAHDSADFFARKRASIRSHNGNTPGIAKEAVYFVRHGCAREFLDFVLEAQALRGFVVPDLQCCLQNPRLRRPRPRISDSGMWLRPI